MLGTDLRGDPRSIWEVAHWVRATSERVRDATDTLEWARKVAGHHWKDDPGDLFALKVEIGQRTADHLVDALDRLAGLLDRAGGGLQRAQELMGEAESIARAGGLDVVSHRVLPWAPGPAPVHDYRLGPEIPQPSPEEFAQQKWAVYERAEGVVERACRILLDMMEALGKRDEEDWSALYFTLGDITRGEIGLAAKIAKDRHYKGVQWALDQAADADRRFGWWSRASLHSGDWTMADKVLERKWEARAWAAVRHERGLKAGMVAKVMRTGMPLLQLGGVVYSVLVEDDPTAKAIVSAGVGIAAGAGANAVMTAWIGAFAAPPAGAIVGIAIGGFVGLGASWFADEAYDRLEPARDKLLRESPGIDSGPTSIKGRRDDDAD
jgi:hypothetical protein